MASLVQNNNEHSLTSAEQKCTGEFGALAGDKSSSLPGTTNRGLWKVYMHYCQPRYRPSIFIYVFLIFSAFSHEKTGTRRFGGGAEEGQ